MVAAVLTLLWRDVAGVTELTRMLAREGKATDPIEYFAAPENRDLGIVKSQRKPNVKLIVAPFPDRQRGKEQFFFETSSGTPLTTAIQA
jgi:hypothetical protein